MLLKLPKSLSKSTSRGSLAFRLAPCLAWLAPCTEAMANLYALPVNERRVDGDKVTELCLWPAPYWNQRADANNFVRDQKNLQPPALPRNSLRDHLHDRNREQTLYDPANPGLTTYVRVTRRRMPTEAAEQEARSTIAHRKENA